MSMDTINNSFGLDDIHLGEVEISPLDEKETENEKVNVRMTAIGLSGSGKTCYIMGMYDQMVNGLEGFKLNTSNQKAKQLNNMIDNLEDEDLSMDRFPAGTSLNDVIDYEFDLSHNEKKIMSFVWADYGGGILEDMGEFTGDVYSGLEKSIENSCAMCIFIDGELLCYEETEKKIKKTRKCARRINPFISKLASAHGDTLPPIVFVITKSDLCAPYLSGIDEIREVIAANFSSVYLNESPSYIVPVTLGNHISDDDYTGEAEPDMYLPFFIGLYHEYLGICQWLKSDILAENERNRNAIAEAQNNIYDSNNRIRELENQNYAESNKWFFFKNKNKIRANEDAIETRNQEIAEYNQFISAGTDRIKENEEALEFYRRLLKEVADQLLSESYKFITIQKGERIKFRTEAI